MADTLIKVDLSQSPTTNENVHNRWHPDIPMVETFKRGEVLRVECYDWTGGQIGNNDSANDIRDVSRRVLRLLAGGVAPAVELPPDAIVVAQDLTPSDAAGLDRGRVRGLCSVAGGATSHVAILARSHDLPAVVAIEARALEVQDGTPAVLDGSAGTLRLHPEPAELESLAARQSRRAERRRAAAARAHDRAVTRDGRRIEVLANIGGFSVEDFCTCCEKIGDRPEIGIIELNISCPNVHAGGTNFGSTPAGAAEVVRAARRVTKKPLYAKLSPNVADIAEVARACEDAGADGLSLINTLVGMRIDIKKRRPVLANTLGGLSGPAMAPMLQSSQ